MPRFESNPDRIAYFETAGWRAYYDRRWLHLTWLLVMLSYEQFHIPFLSSILAAYYVIRASVAWVPLDHDTAKVLRFYERFYRLALRYSGLEFNSGEVAALELEYNDVHRRLSGKPDKTELIDTLIRLHSALFGLARTQVQESAMFRSVALTVVDLITSHSSTDIAADWKKVEGQLQACYRSIDRAYRLAHGLPMPHETAAPQTDFTDS